MDAVAVARFPRHHIEERVLIVVRRLVRFPGASRYSHSSSKHRYSHSHTTHRHSSSHCCTRDRPHGLWETLPRCKVTHIPANSSDYTQNQLQSDNISTKTAAPPGSSENSKIFRPAYAGDATSFVLSLRSRFTRFALRSLAQRLIRSHALRPHDFAAEGQTRADTRTRARSIVIRTRIRHTAIRVRIVAPAIDHTA